MRNISTKVDNTAPASTGRLSAAQFNSIQDEDEHLVATAGITLDADTGPDTDLYMKAQAVARYASGGVFCQDSGAVANSFVLDTPADFVMPKAYFTGMRVLFYAGHNSTGASQINAFGIGSKSLLDHDGVALVGGEVLTGRLVDAVYDEGLLSGSGAFKLAPWANALLFGSVGGGAVADVSWQNLPIYPEITSSGNKFNPTTGTGQVVVDTATTWLWRGWKSFVSSDHNSGARTFSTTALHTYHIRWHAPGTGSATPSGTYPNGRLVIKDLADSVYNPSSLAETDSAFDSTYDDMLICKVVCDSGNNPTVTALINKARLTYSGVDTATTFGYVSSGALSALDPAGSNRILFQYGVDMAGYCASKFSLNWARTPKTAAVHGVVGYSSTSHIEGGLDGVANYVNSRSVDRYSALFKYSTDWTGGPSGGGPIMYGGNGQVVSAYAACDFNATA